jgi:hypothetical protein
MEWVIIRVCNCTEDVHSLGHRVRRVAVATYELTHFCDTIDFHNLMRGPSSPLYPLDAFVRSNESQLSYGDSVFCLYQLKPKWLPEIPVGPRHQARTGVRAWRQTNQG